MSAEEILKANERSAITNSNGETRFVSHVAGKVGGKTKKHKSLGALGLVVLILIIVAGLMSFGNFIPAAISERLAAATDVQYADATESKFLVFQQALAEGNIPENTKKRLQAQGVEVNETVLIYNNETITAENFINKVHSDPSFYNAFTAATYDRAAYYYDASAEKVFRKIGTTRDNYRKASDFYEVMGGLVGEGSDVNVSNVGLVEKENEKGEKYTEYDVVGENANSGSDAENFVKTVAENNINEDEFSATMDAAIALNNADIISKEQKSAIFFMAFMENISKMKAGEGNESKVNEAMNYLFKEQESSVVDTKTGEIITTRGSMLQSPSLYAILAGEKIDVNKVSNYASDRVLKTVENRVGSGTLDNIFREETVTSTGTKSKGTIGRFLWGGEEMASFDSLSATIPTINSSLVNNGVGSIGGIYGGELLVEGAVNVGKMLAKSSGATAGDGDAIKAYARLDNEIAALDAEADRLNRSPFDITSKNTFLGSIFHKFAFGIKNLFSGFSPSVKAEDEGTMYLSNFGADCETISSIGAVGSATCSEIATFDTSTLNDPFNNEGFLAFVEENTELENGKRTIKNDSVLAEFIKYNNERITPIGVMDGGILESISGGTSSIPFISDIISMIKIWLNASDENKAVATGRVFVNSSSNPDWEKYKYAQRYVSLARATEALRQYDGDETAYNNIKYFEGSENPVVAFLDAYYASL